MIAKSLSLQTQPTGIGIEAPPTDAKHFVSLGYLNGVLAPLSAANHAAVTKIDTSSIVITLNGQQISAVVQRKVSLGAMQGGLLDDGSGLAVDLGPGANQAARGSDLADLTTVVAGKAAAVHTHTISDVTGLQAALDGKAALSHGHIIGDVSGLQAALDGKAASSHTHAIADITGLQAALDAAGAGGGSINWKDSVGNYSDIVPNADQIGTSRLVRSEGIAYRCIAQVGQREEQWVPWNFARKYAANVGDGVTTAIAVLHNLNSEDVVVSVRETVSKQAISVDWRVVSVNQIELDFGFAPTSGQYRVTVIS